MSKDQTNKIGTTYRNGQVVAVLDKEVLSYFHSNGCLKAKGSFVNELMQGEWEFFNKDGDTIMRSKFKDDKYHGVQQTIKDNKVIKSVEYINGKKK